MTVHTPTFIHSRVASKSSVSTAEDSSEAKKLLTRILFGWRNFVTEKRDCWRNRVICMASCRHHTKFVFITAWRELRYVYSHNMRNQLAKIDCLFDNRTIACKVEVFCGWRRLSDLKKRVLPKKTLSKQFCVWFTRWKARRSYRFAHDQACRKLQLKCFRSRITRLIGTRQIVAGLHERGVRLRLWRVWRALRWKYKNTVCKKRVCLEVFCVWLSFLDLKKKSKKIRHSQEKQCFHRWKQLLFVDRMYRRCLVRKCFHRYFLESKKPIEKIFFKIWKKRIEEIRNFSKNRIFHLCAKGWRIRAQRKRSVLVKQMAQHCLQNLVKRSFSFLARTLEQAKRVDLHYAHSLLVRAFYSVVIFVRSKKRSARLFQILHVRLAGRRSRAVFRAWLGLKMCMHSLCLRRSSRGALRVWRAQARAQVHERKKEEMCSNFYRGKLGRFFITIWRHRIEYLQTVSVCDSHTKKLWWRIWKDKVCPILHQKRARRELAETHANLILKKKTISGWRCRAENRARISQFVSNRRKSAWREFLQNIAKIAKLEKKYHHLKISKMTRLGLGTILEWLLLTETRIGVFANKAKKFAFFKFAKNVSKNRSFRQTVDKLIKLKFFEKWVRWLAMESLYRSLVAKKRDTLYHAWASLAREYSSVNSKHAEFLSRAVWLGWRHQIEKRMHTHRMKKFRLAAHLREFYHYTQTRQQFRANLQIAKTQFRAHIVRWGVGRLFRAVDAKFDVLVNRKFLLGKRVVRRWKRFMNKKRSATEQCLVAAIQGKIINIRNHLLLV